MGFEPVVGEVTLKEGAANYEKGWEAVGGKLHLTTRRLFFESHKINVNRGGLGIDLRDIGGVRRCFSKLFGILPVIPGAIGIRLKSGEEHRFVVFFADRSNWIRSIEDARR